MSKNKYTVAHIAAKRFDDQDAAVEAFEQAEKNDPNVAGGFINGVVVTIFLKPGSEINALGLKWNQVFLAE